MNRLDLPNRCRAQIVAQESDGTAYTDACCRPLGHPTGHMSLAVDDRKEAARKARLRAHSQTPEEALHEAEAAAEMGMDIKTYRKRAERHGDFQYRVVEHIEL